MIKIYFDWNVLSQMKNGKHQELKEFISNNDNLLIPYSTSHISDLSSGYNGTQKQNEYINSDLEYISSITKDYCLFNNGKGILIDFYCPKELFKQNISEKDTFNDISIDGLMKNFEDDEPFSSLIKPLFNLLKSIPLDESFKQAFENPESSEAMNRMFPDLKENPTMDGFFNSFNKMNVNLNELDGYKQLRETIQSGTGINRNKIFDTENPFEFIQKKQDKLNFNLDDFKPEFKNSPKWFNSIADSYLKLDMHGYQEDKVNIKKGRKETFRNTTEDAFHSAFASGCNFYVINDNKSYKKTKKVFEELRINTQVFKPEEFLEYYKKFLQNQSSIHDLKLIQDILESNKCFNSKTDEGVFKTYYTPYFLFGYFNKIVTFSPFDNPNKSCTFLSQDKPTNWFIIDEEIKKLVNRLLACFGNDIDNKGDIKEKEFNKDNWNGRKWKFHNLILRLQSFNGYVQLYLDMDMEE